MKLDVPAIGIVRGVEPDFFRDLMHISFKSGLSAIELTMNTKDAAATIKRLRPEVPAGKLLGAGTVRNIDEAKAAADAGAMFFVTPNLNKEVIRFATASGIPIIAGALTPSEVYEAWSEGASMVKVFPAGAFGPDYIKDLTGPFESIPLVAVGDIKKETVCDYLNAGAVAVGISSALFGKEAFRNKDIKAIENNIHHFLSTINN